MTVEAPRARVEAAAKVRYLPLTVETSSARRRYPTTAFRALLVRAVGVVTSIAKPKQTSCALSPGIHPTRRLSVVAPPRDTTAIPDGSTHKGSAA